MRARSAGLHTLGGAYVMDAGPESDRASFERHLLRCEQCGEEVRGLREAAARLAEAAAVSPRPELREHTMQAAARVRQQPPLVMSQKRQFLARRRRHASRSARVGARP